jgi:hypothetical protein
MCRAKAVAWATRNPTSPAHVQLRLDSLKRMKQAYEVYAAVSEAHYISVIPYNNFEISN